MAKISSANYLNPFSNAFEQASRDFKLLKTEQKIATVVLTILSGLATCFVGGIAVYAVFCSLVNHFKARVIEINKDDPEAGQDSLERIKEIDRIAIKALENEKTGEVHLFESEDSESEEPVDDFDPRVGEQIDELYQEEVENVHILKGDYYFRIPQPSRPIPIPGSDTSNRKKKKMLIEEIEAESNSETSSEEDLIFHFSDFEAASDVEADLS